MREVTLGKVRQMKLIKIRLMSKFVLMWVLLLSALALTGIASEQAAAFEDIQDHWAGAAIENLHSQGIVSGYSTAEFRPSQEVSRGEVATMLVKALGLDQHVPVLEQVQSAFYDVHSSHWARGYIEVAWEYQLIMGQGHNRFAPEQGMTREELAVLLVRSLGVLPDGKSDEQATINQKLDQAFRDYLAISDWAREGVWLAKELGLIQGFSDGTFRPRETVTRAEAAQMLQKLSTITGKGYQFHGLVQGGDPGLDRLEVMVNGQLIEFKVAANNVFFDQGKRGDWHELVIFAPVYFNLNSQGEINFIITAEKDHQTPDFEITKDLGQTSQNMNITVTNANVIGGEISRQAASLRDDNWEVSQAALPITPEETGRLMNAHQLRQQLNVSGRGIKVAIVDSGVDLGHPDLAANRGGNTKIGQVADVTNEGLVGTVGNQVKLGKFTLPGFLLDSMTIAVVEDEAGDFLTYVGPPGDEGLIRYLAQVGEETFRQDIEAQVAAGEIAVLEGKGFSVYRSEADVIPVPLEKGAVNMAIGEIASDGSWLKFFFDGNGHGTHVAGIVGANGVINGIAPETELIVIKALDSFGESDVPTLKKGIEEAVARGANLVNLSLGYHLQGDDSGEELVAVIEKLSREHGVTFVVAAGNSGPGIGSITTPGTAGGVITVGAYIAPEMWQSEYGLSLSSDIIFGFSSVGPSGSSGIKPDVVAPGVVRSTYPLWAGSGYTLDEGTSMAAPHVTGLLALILEAAHREGMEVSPRSLQLALQQGASRADGLSLLEQGYGKVDAMAAWESLQVIIENRADENTDDLAMGYFIAGEQLGYLPAREFSPGIIDLSISNYGHEEKQVELAPNVSWIRPELVSLRVPPGTTRTVPVYFDQVDNRVEEQGVKVGLMTAVANTPHKIDMVHMVVTPLELTTGSITREGRLSAGHLERYFVPVPENMDSLSLSLRILESPGGNPQGRARMHLFDPNGLEWEVTPFIGAGATGPGARLGETIRVNYPEAGVWELVVASSSWLDNYRLADSRYIVTIHQETSGAPSSTTNKNEKNEAWVIGMMPRQEIKVDKGEQVLWVFNSATRQFYQGLILVNNSLYLVKDGKVVVHSRHLNKNQVTIRLLE